MRGYFKSSTPSVHPFAYQPAGSIFKNCSLGEFAKKKKNKNNNNNNNNNEL